jgi:peptidoglycan/xylan/chitin deacetylase (PgdA/CDA1 family)
VVSRLLRQHRQERLPAAVALALLLVGVGCAVPRAAPVAGGFEVAVTVDDLPAQGPLPEGETRIALARRMLEVLTRHRLPRVYGFVNGSRENEDVLRAWLDAGYPLGNHGWSHLNLNQTEVPAYLADLDRNQALLARLQPGSDARWFRYPFLFEGDTVEKRDAVRTGLTGRGYAVAHVSIDADDWAFNPPYVRCTDPAVREQLLRDFVAGHLEELGRMRRLGAQLAGHEIAQVLLLHIGAADVAALDALLTAYEREGARWVELPAALSDPFYRMDEGPPMSAGAAFPYRAAKAAKVKVAPPIYARGLEERLDAMCR